MKNHKITIDLPDQPSLCKQFILSDDWIKGIATDQKQATGLEKKELEKMLEGDLVGIILTSSIAGYELCCKNSFAKTLANN